MYLKYYPTGGQIRAKTTVVIWPHHPFSVPRIRYWSAA